MIIQLPDSNIFRKWDNVDFDDKRKTLIMRASVHFESVMKRIAHQLNESTYCPYCGKKMTKRTVDHQYPIHYGGPTITNNLLICCGDCNSEKGDLTRAQYEIYRTLPEQKRKEYRVQCLQETIEELKKNNSILPKEWITQVSVKDLKGVKPRNLKENKRINGIKQTYKKMQALYSPIIISKNNYAIFNKELLLWIIKNYPQNSISVIYLENVIYYEK